MATLAPPIWAEGLFEVHGLGVGAERAAALAVHVVVEVGHHHLAQGEVDRIPVPQRRVV